MSKTILLADDSVTIQKVVELTFMDQDYQVIAVSDGQAALAKLAEMRPDLVIADVHMPESNGYDVCRHAKQTHAGLPVLLLVGTFEPFDQQQANAVGADAFLKKPFDSQDLLRQVDQLINQASTASSPLVPDSPPEPAVPAFEAVPAAPVEADPVFDTTPAMSFQAAGAPSEAASDPVFEELSAPAVEEVTAPTIPVSQDSPPPPAAPPPLEVAPEPVVPEVPPTPLAPQMGSSAVEAGAPDLERPGTPSADARTADPGPAAEPPAVEAPARAPDPSPSTEAAVSSSSNGALSDSDVDRIARRVVELAGENVLRQVAWEVVPDLAEVVIKDRIRELESQIE